MFIYICVFLFEVFVCIFILFQYSFNTVLGVFAQKANMAIELHCTLFTQSLCISAKEVRASVTHASMISRVAARQIASIQYKLLNAPNSIKKKFNSKSLLFHQVQINIEHSFKYTITNMIAAWGQPFVIFRSCIFFAVENLLIAQAPQQRNQQWWHFTGGGGGGGGGVVPPKFWTVQRKTKHSFYTKWNKRSEKLGQSLCAPNLFITLSS